MTKTSNKSRSTHKKSNNPAGRPKSGEIDAAIQSAVLAILEAEGYRALTIEKVAERAGVSRPAIYRRYRSVAELALDTFQQHGRELIPVELSGDVLRDLEAYLVKLVRQLQPDTMASRILRGLFSEALLDAEFSRWFSSFIDARREPVLRILGQNKKIIQDADQLADEIFGPIIYRILFRFKTADARYVRQHLQAIERNIPH